MLEPLRAGLWIDHARDKLGRIGLRRAAPTEGLTPAQLRVAELATDGLTNQQIAITLHTSLRSIEAHLTRVYREYGVRSRAQLVRIMAAETDPAPSEAAAQHS